LLIFIVKRTSTTLSIKSIAKKFITGITIPQQYVCVSCESLSTAMQVELVEEDNTKTDITHSHIFLGYKPVIIGITLPLTRMMPGIMQQARIDFFNTGPRREKLASLEVRCASSLLLDDGLIALYQAEHGRHRFLNSFHQLINRFRALTQKSGPENIALPGNESEQVRIAYSIPRIISLVTVRKENLYNVFPTDLHGPVTQSVYAGSLRIGGKANAQVEDTRSVVLSRMELQKYRYAYGLGKNHMRDFQSDGFAFTEKRSRVFDFPILDGATSYHELELFRSVDIGIHRIHFYKIQNFHVLQDQPTLSHIDRYYAQWRLNNKIQTHLLFR
jgi:flavin reductase (DIM6/NTAB) family NADH-FMN oxidoreductase RutF